MLAVSDGSSNFEAADQRWILSSDKRDSSQSGTIAFSTLSADSSVLKAAEIAHAAMTHRDSTAAAASRDGGIVCVASNSTAFLFRCEETTHCPTATQDTTPTTTAAPTAPSATTASICAEINLEYPVQNVQFNADASFLCVADEKRFLHFVHVDSAEVAVSFDLDSLVEAKGLEPSQIHLISFLVSKRNHLVQEMVLILQNSVMLHFKNISFVQLARAITSTIDTSLLNVTQAAISVDAANLKKESGGSVSHVMSVLPWRVGFTGNSVADDGLLLAGEGSCPLSIWSRSGKSNQVLMIDSVGSSLTHTIRKAEVDNRGKYLVLLESSGFLSLWDYKRLILIKRFDSKKISDFFISQSSSEPTSAVTVLVLLESSGCTETNLFQQRHVEIISLPSNIVTHRIQVPCTTKKFVFRGSNACGVIDSAENGFQQHRRVYFLDCDVANEQVRLHVISETQPVEQVRALIRDGLFDNAIAAAEHFGIDREFVLKSKLTANLTYHRNHDSAGTMASVIRDLAQISDIQFCVDFCLDAAIATTFEEANCLLVYARERLLNSDIEHLNLAETVYSARVRLGTFRILCAASATAEYKKPAENTIAIAFSVEKWREFRERDMAESVTEKAAEADLDSLRVLWSRHCGEESLINRLMDVLEAFPAEISSSLLVEKLISWLEAEVVPAISSVELFTALAEWIHTRAVLLESQTKTPHAALRLVRLVLNSPNTKISHLSPFHYQSCHPLTPAYCVQASIARAEQGRVASGNAQFGFNVWEGKAPLIRVKEQLEDLCHLWDVHGFNVGLGDYRMTSPDSIALDLLDRVTSHELLSDAIERDFRVYVARHKLDADHLLKEYCVEVMDKAVSLGKMLAGGSWETRVVCLRQHIENDDVKASILLELMYRSPIPWSDIIDNEIIESINNRTSPCREDIMEQYRLMRLKRMLSNHGIGSFNISDSSKSRALLNFILSNLESSAAMKEAMQVVSIYPQLTKLDAYLIRLRNLFEAGKLDRGLSLLQTGYEAPLETMDADSIQTELDKALDIDMPLEPVQILSAGEEVMSWLTEVMDFAVAEEEKYAHEKDTSKSSFSWAVATAVCLSQCMQRVLQEVKSDTKNSPTLALKANSVVSQHHLLASHITALEMKNSCCSSDTVQSLKNLQDLSSEFDIRISLHNYRHNESARRSILNQFAKEVFKYGQQSKMGTSTPSSAEFSRTELYRLAELLGFERSSLDGIIAEEAARNGDVRTALLLCKELYEKSPDAISAATLKRIALLLTSFAAENKDIFKDMKETKTNFRLTKWILEICQKSVSVCDEELIGDCLDDFKNYELLHAIFTQCDAGDYGTLLSVTAEKPGHSTNYFACSQGDASGSSSSSSSSSISPSLPLLSAFPVKWSVSTKLSDQSLDLDVANVGDTFGSHLFQEHYHEGGLVLSTEKAIGMATEFVLHIATATLNRSETKRLEHSPSKSTSKNKTRTIVCDPFVSGQDLSRYLRHNRVLIGALRMWHRAIELRTRQNALFENEAVSQNCTDDNAHGHMQLVRQLGESVLTSRFIDQNLAFGSLLALPTEIAFEVFKIGMSTTGKDYDRLLKFAAVGIASGLAWNQRSFQVTCQDMAKNARWWHQFNLLNISIETEAFKRTDSDYQRRIIPVLLSKTGMDILTALEFARTYNIEDDFVIFEYIRQLLLNDTMGNEYKYRVAGVLDDISNKPLLISLLYETISTCSPYDYEKISFVFSQILRLDPTDANARKGQQVLEILANFTRTVPPTDIEIQDVASRASIQLNDPRMLSTKSLHYHFVFETKWTAIQPEVKASTLSRLLPLSVPLQISSDQFYVAVVDDFVGRIIGRDPVVFGDVKPFLIKIQDNFVAAKKAAHLAEAFQSGLDKIAAYKQAAIFSQRLVSSSADSSVNATYLELLQTVGAALKTAETSHQLKSHGLEEFCQWSMDPETLMEELYRLKSEEALCNDGVLDLHSIVNEIAARHEIDVGNLRERLLTIGFLQDLDVTPMEKEKYLPSMRVQMKNILDAQSGLAGGERQLQLQLLYLARSVPIQSGIQFLLTVAYNSKSKVRTIHRIRALSILFQLAGPMNFEEAGRNYEEIKSYMQILLYLLDFEELRVVQSVNEFHECEKESLARSLWLNCGQDPQVVQLICNLCLDFGVIDLTLWENALTRLAKFGAVHYLAGIIESVTNTPELSRMPCLPEVWNSILEQLLQVVLESKDHALFTRVLTLLQKCPFHFDLNVASLAFHICRISFSPFLTEAETLSLVIQGLSILLPAPEAFSSLDTTVSQHKSDILVQTLVQISKRRIHGWESGTMGHCITKIHATIHSRREYAVYSGNLEESRALLKYLKAIGETASLVAALREQGKIKEADEIERQCNVGEDSTSAPNET